MTNLEIERRVVTYKFDPSDIQVLFDLIEEVSTPGDETLMVWRQLKSTEKFSSLGQDLQSEIDFAFAYELQEVLGTAGEVRLIQVATSVTATRPMSETPDSAWQLWKGIHDKLPPSVVLAHMADLLLTSRVESTPEHAKQTVDSYLAAASIEGTDADLVGLLLARANFITRSRKMPEELVVRQKMREMSKVFAEQIQTIGPALTLLAALSANPRSALRPDTEKDEIRSRLMIVGAGSTFFIDESAKSLARLASNPEELASARHWHIAQYLAIARAEDRGMAKMHFAQTAARLATDYDLPELQREAILLIQNVDRDSMGWEPIQLDVPLSKNIFRLHLRKYRKSRIWGQALMTFLAGSSPSGDYETVKAIAERNARGSIRSLISQTIFGIHGLPERNNPDFMESEITRTEILALDTASIFLAIELEHISNRFSPPTADQIAEWMVNSFSANHILAAHFAEALTLHWAGKYSDSARLSIPLIESAARGLLCAIDEPLYRTERGESPGRFPTMDFYVDALEKRDLDPDWVRALRHTLLSRGMNLRNLAAHGFIMQFSEQRSALLLRLAGLFSAMPTAVDLEKLELLPTATQRKLRRRLRWVWS